MKTVRGIALVAIAGRGIAGFTSSAQTDRWDRQRDGRHDHHDRWEDWDNRRDARRAGVLAGTAAAGIAGAVARDNARENYRECMDYYRNQRLSERYCHEEHYHDRRRASRVARRTGVVVGMGVEEIVRDLQEPFPSFSGRLRQQEL